MFHPPGQRLSGSELFSNDTSNVGGPIMPGTHNPNPAALGAHLDTVTERRTPIRQGSEGIARSRRFGDRRSVFRDAA